VTGCEEWRGKIDPYVDGELPRTDVLEFEKHLVECEDCHAAYERVRAAVDTVRGASPLYDVPDGSVERAERLVEGREVKNRARRWVIAAGIALATGLAVAVSMNLYIESSPQFVSFAAETHLRYARKAMPLDIVSSDPEVVTNWLGGRVPFHLQLPDYPAGPGEKKRYRLVGARLLQHLNDDVGYLAYEMDDKPISLLMASSPGTAPGSGERYRSGNLTFHFVYDKGLRLISWTDAGINYCLVTELDARGAESCVICHGSPGELRKFEDLTPESDQR
jgi:anti-sigma factor RsiW